MKISANSRGFHPYLISRKYLNNAREKAVYIGTLDCLAWKSSTASCEMKLEIHDPFEDIGGVMTTTNWYQDMVEHHDIRARCCRKRRCTEVQTLQRRFQNPSMILHTTAFGLKHPPITQPRSHRFHRTIRSKLRKGPR